jgi:hypothetical protein
MRKRGHIRRRGEHSWEVKIDCGRDIDGNRIVHYYSVKGTKADANKRLTELLKSQDDGLMLPRPKKRLLTSYGAGLHIGKRRDISRRGAQNVIGN